GIDVSVAAGIDPVTEAVRLFRREKRRRRLIVHVMKAAGAQRPADMLGKAAAGCRHLGTGETRDAVEKLVDLGNVLPADRPPPEGTRWLVGIRLSIRQPQTQNIWQ